VPVKIATRRQIARRRARALRAPRQRQHSVLRALTSSALALPGLAGSAHADAPEGRYSGSYAFSLYREDDLPASKLSTGSPERYTIDSHQFKVEGPIGGRSDLGLAVTYETMSGASPWYVAPGADGRPVQVMSGATIEEQRVDALATGNYYFDNARAGLSGGFSVENDYTSVNGGVEGETHFWEKNGTLTGGLGFSYDMVEPTDAAFYGRVSSETRGSIAGTAALSRVLSRSSVLQSSLTYQHQRGYLSDPYKLVFTQLDGNVPDSRPSQRNQFTWLNRYRKHFSSLGSSLHADYQFYIDDWQLQSHAFELAWHQALWEAFRIVPSLRYYSQSSADFYGPYFVTLAPGQDASSDYRLSPYGALSWRIRGEVRLRGWPFDADWSASVGFERYVSSADLALSDVSVENPGLVSFNVVSVGLIGRF
jgi:hypothetical protein